MTVAFKRLYISKNYKKTAKNKNKKLGFLRTPHKAISNGNFNDHYHGGFFSDIKMGRACYGSLINPTQYWGSQFIIPTNSTL